MEFLRPADWGDVVTVEGPAAYAGQRVAHGGRDTSTVVGERESESESESNADGGIREGLQEEAV